MSIVSKMSAAARLLSIVLFLILNFGITAFFAGNFPLAAGLVPLSASILLILSLAYSSALIGAKQSKLLLLLVFVPLGLSLAFAAIQALHLPSVAFLSNPAWQILPTATFSSISINPGTTIIQLVYALGLLLLGMAVLRMGQHQPTVLVRIIAGIITLASLYGIIVFAQGNTAVLWLPKTSYPESLSATFINRNSFATMAGLGILSCLALALQRVGEISSRLSTSERLRAFGLLVIKPGWPWLGMAIVCFMALVLTNSRAGFMSTVLGCVVLLGSICIVRPSARIPLLSTIAGLALASIMVLSAVGGTLTARLDRAQSDVGERQSIYVISRNIISEYPYTGTGFGTFQQSYDMASRPEQLRILYGLVEHAHNTYYELAIELGLPVMVLLALSVMATIYILLHGLKHRRRAVIWPALGLSAMALVGSHALADFSLSMPAVACATISLIVIGIAQSLSPRKEEQRPTPNFAIRAIPYASATLAGAVLLVSGLFSMANYHAMVAQPTVRSISTVARNVTIPDIFTARQNLETCLRYNPWHPTCGFSLGRTNLVLASTFGLSKDSERRGLALVYLNMARNQYESSLQRAPANADGWYRLARIDAYLGRKEDAVMALNNSILVGPAESSVAYVRVPLMLSYLPDVSTDDQNLYRDNILRIWRNSADILRPVLRANPTSLPLMADLIKDDAIGVRNWKNNIGTPLPAATPVAESPENR